MIRAVALVALAVAPVPPATASAEAIDGSRIIVIDGDTVALPCAVPEPRRGVVGIHLRVPALAARIRVDGHFHCLKGEYTSLKVSYLLNPASRWHVRRLRGFADQRAQRLTGFIEPKPT